MVDIKTISSAEKYNISGKRVDTDKWWSFGNFSLRPRPGKDQPQLTIGIRKTKEFVDLLNATERDGWINLYVFEDNKKAFGSPPEKKQEKPTEYQEVPF